MSTWSWNELSVDRQYSGNLLMAVGIGVLVLSMIACDGDGGYRPRLTPEIAEALAGRAAFQGGSDTAIFCDVVTFQEWSRAWLVECVQDETSRWVVDDQSGEVRPEAEASGSPTETPA